ncbi:MAG: hypothetical protein EOP56_00720 [Sphingobacteriales bacterium]|nr:MAG: hypothetical protein EOP56_00720 [Sphingobacteriales bacterium]
MIKRHTHNRPVEVLAILLLLPIIFFTSCSSSKRVTYFQDIPDSLVQPLAKAQSAFVEPTIKVGDVLSISISTIDASVLGTGSSVSMSASSVPPTYLVDKHGNVDLPVVGRIAVQNRTTSDVKDMIYDKAMKYYVNPIVNVRFGNFNVTVLGDVLRPGTYTFTNEKVTVMDAIGQAGDIAITGRRDNVLLVREDNGQKLFIRLNLNTATILQSPYFYLRSGDVLQVEAVKAKVNSATIDMSQERYLSYIFSGLSLLFSIANIVIQINRN